jgi:hypothetical protein
MSAPKAKLSDRDVEVLLAAVQSGKVDFQVCLHVRKICLVVATNVPPMAIGMPSHYENPKLTRTNFVG